MQLSPQIIKCFLHPLYRRSPSYTSHAIPYRTTNASKLQVTWSSGKNKGKVRINNEITEGDTQEEKGN